MMFVLLLQSDVYKFKKKQQKHRYGLVILNMNLHMHVDSWFELPSQTTKLLKSVTYLHNYPLL